MDSEARPEIRTQLEQEPSNESRGPSDRAESAPESLADLKTKTEIKKLEAETRVAERALWMPFGSAGLQVVLAFIQGASIILAAYFALAPQITTLKSEVTKQERVLAELGEAVKTASKTVEILHVAINDAGKALDALHQSVRALNMVTNANARQNHLSQIQQEFVQNRYMPDASLKSLEVAMAEFHKDVLSPKEFEQDLAKLKFFIDRDKDMLSPTGPVFYALLLAGTKQPAAFRAFLASLLESRNLREDSHLSYALSKFSKQEFEETFIAVEKILVKDPRRKFSFMMPPSYRHRLSEIAPRYMLWQILGERQGPCEELRIEGNLRPDVYPVVTLPADPSLTNIQSLVFRAISEAAIRKKALLMIPNSNKTGGLDRKLPFIQRLDRERLLGDTRFSSWKPWIVNSSSADFWIVDGGSTAVESWLRNNLQLTEKFRCLTFSETSKWSKETVMRFLRDEWLTAGDF